MEARQKDWLKERERDGQTKKDCEKRETKIENQSGKK